MPGGFSSGFSSGFGSTPIPEAWRLWAVLYSAAFVQVAVVPRILTASTVEAVNRVGSFQFTIPANDIDDSLLTYGRIVGLFYEPDGEIMRGRIEHTVTSDSNDAPTITVSCLTLAVELVWQDTYYAVASDNDTPMTILQRMLADTENTWSTLCTGGDFVNLTNQFPPSTCYQAALTLAEMEGAYLRETYTPRELELSQETHDSGIVLIAPPVAPLQESDVFGFIAGLPSIEKDGSAVQNRIMPLGLNSDSLLLSLGQSDRTTPYTIGTIEREAPIVTEAKFLNNYDLSIDGGGDLQQLRGSIQAIGQHRAVIVFAAAFTNGVAQTFVQVDIGGIFATEIFSTADANLEYLFGGFVAVGVPDGDLSVNVSTTDNPPRRIDAVVVALKNVHQSSPIRDFAHDLEANDNFSPTLTPTISVTGIDSATNDILVDGLMAQHTAGSNPAATPAAGQTALGTELDWGTIANPAVGLTTGSSKPGAAGSQTMSWTLSPTTNYLWAAHAGVSVKSQPVYYIEDATSISSFGRRVARLVLNANRIIGATAAQLTAAANTLYDRAVTRLLRAKDGVTAYDVDLLSLPRVPWLVGDSMRLVYTGRSNDGVYLSVDASLIVLERQRSFDQAGTLKWKLRLANVYQHPASIAELLYGTEARLGEMETAL